MTTRPGLLALGAVIATAAATIAAAPDRPAAPVAPTSTSTAATGTVRTAMPSGRSVAVDPVVARARAYALTARNWTARTYPAVWRWELALTAGAYRRQLRAARPTRALLAALEADAAASAATVTRVRRDPRVRAPRARVLLWLTERTTAAGQTITGTTRNQVLLRQARGGRWRVTGWTALPGPEATP
jgi:hypothetical protein